MKKNKLLESNIKKMQGNVLAIGINDDNLLKAINKNNKILECNILSNNLNSNKKGKKNKKFYLSKLRKKFKKKKIDYLICDYKTLEDFLKTFIKDSIYITKGYIYFCTNNPELIKKKYLRYNIKLEEIKCSDNTVLIIDVSKAKNNKIKELYYQIIDGITYLIDIITELLLS
jgi:hypothetical protein